ncbi:hypothetical protein F5Y08DRAFT_214267 [Xylaria arbuscula]|nr:hypothetical protein F5Y08DRAFT_214267 [Xylaria arbuscula]
MDPFSDSGSRTLTETTLTSSKSFLGRYLSRRDVSISKNNEQEPSKGPLGLTTLFEPDGQAVADIIFVHGLNGGSRSTWTKGSQNSYWPQDWLSRDEAFQDVRVHTFGYSSGLNRESILNISDFATNLLACVYHCPVMASQTSSRIIFVGHSMGGLVIKRACILAHQIPEYDELAGRIHAMFFLATPHQGAGIAQLLNRFLALAGPRPFVDDLIPQSDMLQTINEEFPRYSDALQLFSFFESQPMYYGIGKGLIVERHCAVMSYANERRTYLDANHRDVARFSTPKDPSYILVRNALATTIEAQRQSFNTKGGDLDRAELEALSKFLGVAGAPEDELIANESRKLSGSCQWLVQKESFEQWRDSLTSKLFWLQGRPGAGKTVLASHVIDYLRESGLDCCYFYFKHGDENRGNISALLRSMAWQMAALHRSAFTTISKLTNSFTTPPVDKADHVSTWRHVFASALLKSKLQRPQYWVIDALDECENDSEVIFFLRKAQELWPLCILITSRTGVEACLNPTDQSVEVVSESILEGNREDIALFLKANLQYLPGTTTITQQDISYRILHNSRGCFLWVRLVLDQLRLAHTPSEIDQVLDNDHSDMNTLYARILDEMSRAKFGKAVAKAILTWVTCAFRPLSVGELRLAIEANAHLVDDVERSISTCGNLVFVDERKKVQLVHLTVREFLTQKAIESEFMVDQSAAHKRLALACIQTLCGGQGNSKRGSKARLLANDVNSNADSPLYDYAASYLFQHLMQLDSPDDETLHDLAKFLGSRNVLSWIEHLAKQADLPRVYQAGKTCMGLITRRKAQISALGVQEDVSLIERWGIDLVMLVNKFGKKLSQVPSSIHSSIPPFCPSESAFRKQFVAPYNGLTLSGCVPEKWDDDHLCTIYYPRPARPSSMVSSLQRTAVTLNNRTVVIYDNESFLQTNTFVHSEYIIRTAFSEDERLLATVGGKTIKVWSLDSSDEMMSFRVPAHVSLIAFIDDDSTLLIACGHSIIYWDVVKNVARGETIDWTDDVLAKDADWLRGRLPTMVAFSAEQNLLAMTFKGRDIILWALDGEQIYDILEKDIGSYRYRATKVQDIISVPAKIVAFGSTLEYNLLVAAYLDGDVVVFDTDTGEHRGSLDQVNAQAIACSPDGRLAIAVPEGNIDLFDLKTLNLIFRLRFDGDRIPTKTLNFTPHTAGWDQRLLSIRGGRLGVWDSSVLQRRGHENEVSDTVSQSAIEEGAASDANDGAVITAITCMRDSPQVIWGRIDGTVHIYDISSEPRSQQLFTQQENCGVKLLQFDDDSRILTCAGFWGRVTCRKLTPEAQGNWVSGGIIFEKTGLSYPSQTIFSSKHDLLLVSTDSKVMLWNLADPIANSYIACIEVERRRGTSWFSPPSNEDLLIYVNNGVATLYEWKTLTPIRSVRLAPYEDLPMSGESIISFQRSRYFATARAPKSGDFMLGSWHQLWDCEDFQYKAELPRNTTREDKSGEGTRGGDNQISPVLDFKELDIKVDTVIGIYNERAVFLDRDNWVCSINIVPSESTSSTTIATDRPSLEGRKIIRHFFIPDNWMSSEHKLLMEVRPLGDLVIAKQRDLAVVRCGLEITRKSIGGVGSRRVSSSARSVSLRPAEKR